LNFENIDIRNFRNIAKISVPFHRRFNVFVGDNGQGKTNLVEALYFLINGSSFRTAKPEHFIPRSELSLAARIKSVITRGLLSDQLEAQLTAESRNLTINQKKVSVQKLCGNFPAVIFSPESLVAIKSGPEFRRDLVDEVVKHSRDFGAQLILDYKKVLLSRNRLLREGVKGRYAPGTLQNLMQSIDVSFLRSATSLTAARIELIDALNPIFEETFRSLTQTRDVNIRVDYLISEVIANGWRIEKIYTALCQSREKRRIAELANGTSLVGPHKHDIRFLYNGNDSRFFCSQGQQRALILAFKITQIVYHRRTHDMSPILFLDDVMSELDSAKRSYLLRFLLDHDSQTFITTTDIAQLGDFELNDLGLFRIRDGQVDDGAGIN
jgi:DNA replication and repair protein RecF